MPIDAIDDLNVDLLDKNCNVMEYISFYPDIGTIPDITYYPRYNMKNSSQYQKSFRNNPLRKKFYYYPDSMKSLSHTDLRMTLMKLLRNPTYNKYMRINDIGFQSSYIKGTEKLAEMIYNLREDILNRHDHFISKHWRS